MVGFNSEHCLKYFSIEKTIKRHFSSQLEDFHPRYLVNLYFAMSQLTQFFCLLLSDPLAGLEDRVVSVAEEGRLPVLAHHALANILPALHLRQFQH